MDAASQEVWRRVNRGARSLEVDLVLEGIQEFAKNFSGKLNTETMLVKEINDSVDEIGKIAIFISGIKPKKVTLPFPFALLQKSGLEGLMKKHYTLRTASSVKG